VRDRVPPGSQIHRLATPVLLNLPPSRGWRSEFRCSKMERSGTIPHALLGLRQALTDPCSGRCPRLALQRAFCLSRTSSDRSQPEVEPIQSPHRPRAPPVRQARSHTTTRCGASGTGRASRGALGPALDGARAERTRPRDREDFERRAKSDAAPGRNEEDIATLAAALQRPRGVRVHEAVRYIPESSDPRAKPGEPGHVIPTF